MTRGNYLTAIFGAAVSSLGWFLATDIPIVKVGAALLVALWAARWLYVYRQTSQTVVVILDGGALAREVVPRVPAVLRGGVR
jgi:hypothetical protein